MGERKPLSIPAASGAGRKGFGSEASKTLAFAGCLLLLSGCVAGVGGGASGNKVVIQGGADFANVQRDLDERRVLFLEGVLTRDRDAMQTLMTPDFTWREDNLPMEETPFDFWDRHRLWSALERLLKAKMVYREGWYVAPVEAVRESYTGPRLGWRRVGEDWRLGYFHPGAWTESASEPLKERESRSPGAGGGAGAAIGSSARVPTVTP